MNNEVYNLVADKFDGPGDIAGHPTIDLRAFTHGQLPVRVRDNLSRFASDWEIRGVDAWNRIIDQCIFLVGDEDEEERERAVGWWNLPEVIGDRFIARLLKAEKGSCIMLPNVTTVMQQLLSCQELNQPGRRKVVTTDGEFSAVIQTLHAFNRQFDGYPPAVKEAVQLQIAVADMDKQPFDAEKILAQIDDQTALVVISHVGFLRGEVVQDEAIQRIVEKAHAHGAIVAIDGYHAIGSHETDVQKLGVDVYFGGLLKEGCGSSGNGFLYVRPELELTPQGGWFGVAEPFAFEQQPNPHQNVVRRFLSGTTPIAPLYHGIEGLKIFLNIGIPRIVADVKAKVKYVVDTLTASGIEVVSPQEETRMSALIVVEVEEADKLRQVLKEEYGILVDARQNRFLRLAPFVYNSAEQIESAVNAIVATIRDGSYKSIKLATEGGPVT